MNDVPLCSIAVAEQLAAADLEDLEMALQADSLQLQKPPKRVFGVDDVLVIVGLASGVAQLVDYGIKASKAIINWRKKLRAKDLDAGCILEHPRRSPLDLRTASDEEILEWFQR
jgi:hypothetical protein